MEKAPSTKRPRYDAVFRAEALRLASESRSTLAAARALNIDPQRLHAWQKAVQPPLPADPFVGRRSAGATRGQQTGDARAGHFKKIHRHLLASPNPMIMLHLIGQQRVHRPVQQLCQVLGIVPSRCHA